MDDTTLPLPDASSQPPASSFPEIRQWGRLRLIQRVGQGAFGEVYRAWDPELEREVALKLLLLRGRSADSEYEAIRREARVMARVRHANIVPVYGVDRHEERVGFWSDFVHGNTLAALLNTQGPFSAHETALIGVELCRALSAVHAAGLLHRDIKAGNVMREDGGRILLMDFGLSHESTAAYRYGGTPLYMAPELFTGKPPSVRSDIYALGVLLYFLVSGKYPVEGGDIRGLAAEHAAGARRNLIDQRPDLPPEFAHVVETAVHPDPAQRYSSAGQMLAALSKVLGSSSVPVQPAVPARKRHAWTAGAVIAVAAVIAGGVLYNRTTPAHGNGPGKALAGTYYQDYQTAQHLLANYYKPNSLPESIRLFEKTIAANPKFAPAFAGAARAYYLQYRAERDPLLLEKARAACTQALELDRQLTSAHVTLGMIAITTGNRDLAGVELGEAQRIDGRNAEVYGALAELYQAQGRNADVEPTLQKARDLAPDDWRWPNRFGGYYLDIGNLQAAVGQFQEAIRLTPDNPRSYSNLAVAHLRMGHLQEAQSAAEHAIRLEPGAPAYGYLGYIFLSQRRFAEAVEMYRKAVQLNPSDYITWGDLGSAYQWSQGHQKEARESYLKAIELAERSRAVNPNEPRLLANLASYQATLGNKDQSLRLIRQALALAPDNPDVMFRAGEAYELMGRRSEALQWVERALELGYSAQYVQRSPELAALRSDRGFAKVAKKYKIDQP